MRDSKLQPNIHRVPCRYSGQASEGWRDGEAPDVDDLPHVHGADLQECKDVVGQGHGVLGQAAGGKEESPGCQFLVHPCNAHHIQFFLFI